MRNTMRMRNLKHVGQRVLVNNSNSSHSGTNNNYEQSITTVRCLSLLALLISLLKT